MENFLAKNYNKENIKCIIFDFDATMYYSPTVMVDYVNYIKKTIMTLSSHNERETKKLMKQNGFTLTNKSAPSFTSSCGKFGVKKEDWDRYRIDNFVEVDYSKATSISNNFLKALSKKYSLFIVSNEVDKNIKYKAEKLGIDLSYFTAIVGSSPEEILNQKTATSKSIKYLDIMKKYNFDISNVLVFGDRLKVDIEPIIELGGSGIQVTHPKEIEEFCQAEFSLPKPKKILILSVTVGAGHNQVAKILAEKFNALDQNAVVYHLFDNAKFSDFVIKGIFRLMNIFVSFSNFLYNNTKKKNNNAYEPLINLIKKDTLKLINEFKPDVIISTHIAGFRLVDSNREQINHNIENYFIVTDYEITPGIIHNDNKYKDYFVVPNEDFKKELVSRGFNEANVLPFGIPVNEKSYIEQDIEETIKELNIDFDCKKITALVCGGGSGLGKNYSVIKQLSKIEDIQIISVAGKNERLKEKVDKLALKSRAKIFSYGFTDKLDKLMTISNIVIGKSGGLTATEAMIKNKPIMVVGKVPHPEYANLKYFVKKGCALEAEEIKSLQYIIKSINYDKLEDNCKKLDIQNSAELLCDFVIKNQK